MNRKVFFWGLLICFFILNNGFSQNSSAELTKILELRKKSRDATIDLEDRLKYALKASEFSENLGVDSTLMLSNRNLAVIYFEMNDYEKYLPQNHRNLKLATKLKDTSSLAIATFNLGTYYGYFLPADSAFYYLDQSLTYYDYLDDAYNMGIVLSFIAKIQTDQKDYLAAEENIIRALTLFLSLPETDDILYYLQVCYDLMGKISLFVNAYDLSIEYHNKAIEIAQKLDDNFEIWSSKNNIAFTLRKQEKFDESLELYREVLNAPGFFQEDPEFYSLVLDNIAYTRFVRGDQDFDAIEDELRRAYFISDSIDSDKGRMFVSIDLSKVLFAQNKLDSAKAYAQESYNFAKQLEDNEILLDALLMLGKSTSGEKGEEYLISHIKLSDSLLQIERSARNKFARVKFNTDQIEEENERITRQRQWLIGISAALLITVILIYIIITQRAKNKELQFIQDQQKANEEIYNLLLSQQDKIDEARANEKKRISQEIHDGVLGRMFGVRLSLDSLNFKTGPESINSRAQYINELKTIEEDMRKISHELNTDFIAGSGFMDILEELIEKQTTAYKLKYSFNFTDDIHWETVNNKVKINIYRILQESLQNIYKHAEADKVWIDLGLKNDKIVLQIRDDGKGFDTAKGKKGIGIKNINARTADVGGTVKIDSIINHGTSVEFQVPYNN